MFEHPASVVQLAVIWGYLMGSVPYGLLLTRAAGLGDVRAIGSGNIGATNVLRTGHKGLAAATLIADMLKGTIAVLVAGIWGKDLALVAAAEPKRFRSSMKVAGPTWSERISRTQLRRCWSFRRIGRRPSRRPVSSTAIGNGSFGRDGLDTDALTVRQGILVRRRQEHNQGLHIPGSAVVPVPRLPIFDSVPAKRRMMFW